MIRVSKWQGRYSSCVVLIVWQATLFACWRKLQRVYLPARTAGMSFFHPTQALYAPVQNV